jgi:hypothetical protein
VYWIVAVKKMCDEAIEVTANLAAQPADTEDYHNQRDRFWELYYGPMYDIEMRQQTVSYTGSRLEIVQSGIESAMVDMLEIAKRRHWLSRSQALWSSPPCRRKTQLNRPDY